MELLQGETRTKYCGQFQKSDLKKVVVAQGWVDNRRDFGGLIFVDLRDKTGVLQVVLNAQIVADFEHLQHIRNEFVLSVRGTLVLRSADTVNSKLETGEIELLATSVKIINTSATLPFSVGDEQVSEALRLKYRYLDLRNATLQKTLALRAQVSRVARNYLDGLGFTEVETPMLGKSTPEGARDYLVPSRMFEGSFFALPQSPQLYKQLLMIGGVDKYYQIARCFRDEDLRADRQPEFTQIDVEMSFVDQEKQLFEVAEGLVQAIFMTVNHALPTPFKTMTYDDAMSRFGCDKPDTRFGLELTDVSPFAMQSTVAGFHDCIHNGGSVRAINAKNLYDRFTRKDLDGLAYFVKDFGAMGLSWIAVEPEGLKGSLVKFFPEAVLQDMLKLLQAQPNDVLLFVADGNNDVVFQSLAKLRLYLAEKFGLIDPDRYDVLWVTDFPMFEYSTSEKRLVAKHHPFTSPKDEDFEKLQLSPLSVKAKAYDLVINGYEAGGGSLRNYDPVKQAKIFETLGFSQKDIEEKFGFFMQAFEFGTPPHGGLALGLDRLLMLLTHSGDIRSVIAFPKIQTSMDLMTGAPALVEKQQLNDVYLSVKPSLMPNFKKE